MREGGGRRGGAVQAFSRAGARRAASRAVHEGGGGRVEAVAIGGANSNRQGSTGGGWLEVVSKVRENRLLRKEKRQEGETSSLKYKASDTDDKSNHTTNPD